jgi:lipoic acid synthetase
MDRALEIFKNGVPDVFNHNLETIPRLYRECRPGANYKWSLELLRKFKEQHPEIPTKSGLMMGMGETNEEMQVVLNDLREHNVNMLTLGQYLQPSKHHFPVKRYVPPAEFDALGDYAKQIGFTHAACGPMVRSSYHADKQALGEEVK